MPGAGRSRANRATMLVDSSVWVDHLRRGNRDLTVLLDRAEVECHPFIIGELACGSLGHRSEVLFLLQNLPSVPKGSHNEVLAFVERHRLMGRRIGWIDAYLLVAASLAGVPLWTYDRRLSAVTRALNLQGQP